MSTSKASSTQTDVSTSDQLRERRRSRRSLNRVRSSTSGSLKSVHFQKQIFLCAVVIIGATGDIAKRKVYPALWNLYKNNLLPPKTHFYGFCKTTLSAEDFADKYKESMKVSENEESKYLDFCALNRFYTGNYLSRIDYEIINKEIHIYESDNEICNRLIYIALPNSYVEAVIPNVRALYSNNKTGGWTRVVIDKPYCRDIVASDKVTQQLLSICKEEDIYRIDNYLGCSMIQNMLIIRFGNLLFNPTWNRNYVSSVLITLKDSTGLRNNGKYFDNYGIVRDVMQSHLLQILCFLAMERPTSIDANDIREEKIRLLKCIQPVALDDVVVGQYVGNPLGTEGEESKLSFTHCPEVSRNSNTPTYCAAVLRINNDRWEGVPFIMECGVAVDEDRTDIRMQYQEVPANMFENKRNEVVIEVEPRPNFYIKTLSRSPMPSSIFDSTLSDLSLTNDFIRNPSINVTENLILQVFSGSQAFFIRSDEFEQGWRIFSPLLSEIDSGKLKPTKYVYGTRGPVETDKLIERNKFIKDTKLEILL